jgi:hypothetical protein
MGHYLEKVREWEKKRASAPIVTSVDNKERIKKALRERGIVAIESALLDGEVIYFARDEEHAQKVPTGAVVYTLEELRAIVQNPPGQGQLKQIHEAKKMFSGKVIQGV